MSSNQRSTPIIQLPNYPITKSQSGFTLVELLVVVGILAILAATIIPRFTGRTEQARLSSAKSSVRSLGSALATYEADNGEFPSDSQGLAALMDKPSGDPEPMNWKGPYVPRDVSLKDPWGTRFTYKIPGDRNRESYDLYSWGPDRREGTADDITNWAAPDK